MATGAWITLHVRCAACGRNHAAERRATRVDCGCGSSFDPAVQPTRVHRTRTADDRLRLFRRRLRDAVIVLDRAVRVLVVASIALWAAYLATGSGVEPLRGMAAVATAALVGAAVLDRQVERGRWLKAHARIWTVFFPLRSRVRAPRPPSRAGGAPAAATGSLDQFPNRKEFEMKKLIIVGIGVACAFAFIGFDAVHAMFDKSRSAVRSHLMSPEMELEAQISEAKELAEKCGESVINGKVALARLETMIEERQRDIEHRERSLDRDRRVLERRQVMLRQDRRVYLIGDERVSKRTLNRDALLRAKAFQTDAGILEHLRETADQLRVQKQQTGLEIEAAMSEQVRLDGEIDALTAQLENLKARKAVAQTREESKYVFDRSTFDQARDKIAGIRATIAEQNKRLDFYGRRAGSKGIIPADIETEEEDALSAIASALGEPEPAADDLSEEDPAPVASLER